MIQKYVALKPMSFPNPGNVPSVLRLEPGEIFSLDGNEGLNVDSLLSCGVIRRYVEPKKLKEVKADE